MEIVIDFSTVSENPMVFILWFFKTIGWIIPVVFLLVASVLGWQAHIRNKYRKERKYILLAIDVPKNNEQTPKAVENIFNHLAGAHQPLKFRHKWLLGEIPDSFSFEIVSIGGYIQFIVHLVEEYRDLIEAIIYAQYPDAEITEIEDYTTAYRRMRFPNERFDLWGGEMKLAKSQYLPIRTYREFEDPAAENVYKDSMAGLLEVLTRIGPGEQIWISIVVTPADNDWGEDSANLIAKMTGQKTAGGRDFFNVITDNLSYLVNSVISTPGETSASNSKNEPSRVPYMTKGEKDTVEAIEVKTGKIGFHVRSRLIYFGEKGKFRKPLANAIYGAFKQFNTLDLNSLKMDGRYLTGGIFFFKKRRVIARQNKILRRYIYRGHYLEPGSYGQIMNSEELASIWHFPTLVVKAPLVKTTEAKRSQPPMSLPIEQTSLPPASAGSPPAAPRAEPPQNLPT